MFAFKMLHPACFRHLQNTSTPKSSWPPSYPLRSRGVGGTRKALTISGQSDLDFVLQWQHGSTFAPISAQSDLDFVPQGPHGSTFPLIPDPADLVFVPQGPHGSTFPRIPVPADLVFVPQCYDEFRVRNSLTELSCSHQRFNQFRFCFAST